MIGGGLEPGIVLGDRYRLRRLLGEGGMGWVWEAIDVSTDQPVALKLLKSTKEDDRKRFQREVRAAAAIRHPNVIGVHELVELPDGMLVIVMDLLDGETLAAVLRRDKTISLRELADIFLPVLAALEAAHAVGIIHRDVKPDNIFLCRTDAKIDVKVLDFGIAKLTAEEGLAARTQALTGTGSMVGTPYYMSPEQVFGDKDLDPRADIWSLGIVMYECLTGKRPTEGDTVGRVLKRIMAGEFDAITVHCADVPHDVASLVARMLSAEREDRPRDLGEIREVLERYVGSPGRRVSTPEPVTAEAGAALDDTVARADTNRGVSVAPSRPSRVRSRILAAGTVLALTLIGSAVYLRGQSSAVDPKTPRAPASSAVFTSSDPPSASPDAAGPSSPTATAMVLAKESPPAPSASASASASPSGTSSIAAAKPASPLVSKPACEKGEVVSEGHCCPRGHMWRTGRCERPLATSF